MVRLRHPIAAGQISTGSLRPRASFGGSAVGRRVYDLSLSHRNQGFRTAASYITLWLVSICVLINSTFAGNHLVNLSIYIRIPIQAASPWAENVCFSSPSRIKFDRWTEAYKTLLCFNKSDLVWVKISYNNYILKGRIPLHMTLRKENLRSWVI